MKIRGLGRVQSSIHKVQNRLGAHAVILLYHRVAEGLPDPQCLAVSPARFAEHLSLLAETTCPVSLEELPSRLKSRRRNDRPLSVITFDDGYADNLEQAAPILAGHGVPATVFIAAAAINHQQEFYWDALGRILLRPDLPPDLSLHIGSAAHAWNFSGEGIHDASWDVRQPPGCSAQEAYLEIAGLIRNLPPAGREEVLDQLFDWSGISRSPQNRDRTMSEAEICRLTASGLIAVGAHTVNHPVLSVLEPDAQAREIQESRVRLEGILGQPVSTFSYPFGRAQDYSRQTVKLVREEGFCCACSNFAGLANRWTDPFQLPRICVRDIDGDEFSKMLAGVYETFR
jgi:peptidoglycan/xylan/chitin deacetylase (PgdA/CDA1 family)